MSQFTGLQSLTSPAEGVQMMLFLAANEGARIIEEGLVIRER